MPSSDSGTTLARQWELLRILPSRRPGHPVIQLRNNLSEKGFDVSKRTVQRDLIELSAIFPIATYDDDIPFGWYWSNQARGFDILGMELTEALSLGLLEDVLRQIMPPTFLSALEGKFSMAREKLSALPKNRNARWKDLVCYVPPGLPFIPPTLAKGVLPAIQDALLQQKQLSVVYRKAGSKEASEQILNPLSLIQQGARSYLVACAFDYDNPIQYALHRIISAKILTEPSRRPKGYALDGFIASGANQFGEVKSTILKAQVSSDLAGLLEETPLSKDQKITTRSGINTLTATVSESWNLYFWVLSQGEAIVVQKPLTLRKNIISTLEGALGNYKS
jgi:predicted DNA-binding transcriptional regulator YafY